MLHLNEMEKLDKTLFRLEQGGPGFGRSAGAVRRPRAARKGGRPGLVCGRALFALLPLLMFFYAAPVGPRLSLHEQTVLTLKRPHKSNCSVNLCCVMQHLIFNTIILKQSKDRNLL